MLFSLKLITGEIVQHHVHTDVVTIGRSKNCSIVAPYEGISRNHCQINFENGEIFITDLGSTNGVFVDGAKIEPNVKIPYQTFLMFSIGSIQSITIEFDDKTAVKSQNSLNASENLLKDNELTATKAYTSEVQKTQKEIALKLKASTPKESPANRSNIKTPPKNKTQEKSSLTKPIAILLLVGALIWYFSQEEGTGEAENSDTVHSTKPSKSSEKNFEQY